MSRARLAEARGDAAGLVAALEPVRSFPIRDAVDEPGFWSWQDLYAEGLVGVGRSEEADEMLRVHEERAPSVRQGIVGGTAGARPRAGRGGAGPARAGGTGVRAALDAAGRGAAVRTGKVELAAGGFLRRVGQRRRAVELLTAALATFERLGARPYAERCRTELAASGLQPARGAARRMLTSQELVVARLAAAGGRTGRSPRSWSSASRRSSTTCATSSRSSGSPGASSWPTC